MSPQTAYQVTTSILEGVIKRGTGKKLKKQFKFSWKNWNY